MPLTAWMLYQTEETHRAAQSGFIPIPRIKITDAGVEVHHGDILHPVYVIRCFVMVTDLCNQLEQQSGAFHVVDFRFIAELFQNHLLAAVLPVQRKGRSV